jgi:hypothetical protein
VTGAAFGDSVDVCAHYSTQGLLIYGYVVSANTVAARLHNATGATINLASGQWTVKVRRLVPLPALTKDQVIGFVKNNVLANA